MTADRTYMRWAILVQIYLCMFAYAAFPTTRPVFS
jgi:hypothetical protein